MTSNHLSSSPASSTDDHGVVSGSSATMSAGATAEFRVDEREVAYDSMGGKTWRAWLHGVHVHSSPATHGSLTGYGPTPDAALERLKASAANGYVHPTSNCSTGCPRYSYAI